MSSSGADNYTRDLAGNRLSDGAFSYGYAANNRLISATSADMSATYLHNGKGERMKKTVNGASTIFFYDGSGNIIGEYNGAGSSIREHVYGPSGRLVSIDTSDNIYWHHNDHLGSPQAMTDSSGVEVWKLSQTPFGIATINEDPDGDGINVINNFRFPGQYYDVETGQSYNYFRTYDPMTGRYTQNDPIGLKGGINPFGYVGGDPVKWTDPQGLFIAQTIGASIGVGFELYNQVSVNGWNNLDYKRLGLAGLTGALGGFAKNITGAGIRGAFGSAAMDGASQIECAKFNPDQLLNAVKFGAVGGFLGGVGNSAGRAIQKSGSSGIINNVMYPELNSFRSVGNYGNHGAAIGGVVGGYHGNH